mmetsp:Transcript_13356/g.25304  ORF Transcript_13356/g.25304 Transcript_13356/m.25304 type:complete len:257 (-) Transcript_13356:152-922(-)
MLENYRDDGPAEAEVLPAFGIDEESKTDGESDKERALDVSPDISDSMYPSGQISVEMKSLGGEISGDSKIAGEIEIPEELRRLETLDEPVTTTILRDLKKIWVKMKHVLLPTGSDRNLRDWDLWGPLLLCLTLSITMSSGQKDEQVGTVFATVFVLVWCGSVVLTLNVLLLGGTLSFLQSICVLGYCLAPLNFASIIIRIYSHHVLNAIVVLLALSWSVKASFGFMAQLLPPEQKALGVYPVFLFYLTLGWMILMQ